MNIKLLSKYNTPGPRYTSYPPATFFDTNFTSDTYVAALQQSNTDEPANISLYVHVPFCPQLCHFCGCNTSVSKSEEFVARYFDAIIAEIRTVAAHLDKGRKVTQIHWGGGTPNAAPLPLIKKVMEVFAKEFTFDTKAEIAMECNPAYLEFEHIEELAAMGFNRLSLGIQDFDSKVLLAVNRQPSKHRVSDLVAKMKACGFSGVNMDLIYGLPLQTIDSFRRSVEEAIRISPDRLVTFSYAHVPWVKSAQKLLEDIGLPEAEQKLQMYAEAHTLLTTNGYVAIGMDHYAKPNDELSVALQQKTLHRNFQGYCTRATTGQVYGFGATSISQLWGAYSQNIKEPEAYVQSVEVQGLAVARGYTTNADEQLRRDVINEIMCNGLLDFEQIAQRFGVSVADVKQLTAYEEQKFQTFVDDKLLKINHNKMQLIGDGIFVVRNIAMALDPMLKTSTAQFSKTV